MERIIASITENGFDASQPVRIWAKTDDDGSTHKYLIDGYTRVAALKKAGLETVPYFEHRFENFEDAYKYVLGLQANRQNLESGELLRNVAKLAETDFVKNAEGKKSEIIAAVLGLGASGRTVEKALSVLKNADAETLAQIEEGTLSVHKAYKKDKHKSNRNVPLETSDENADAISDSEGNPPALNFNHSDGIERPSGKLSQKEDFERTKERRAAYENGFSGGLKKGSDLAYEVYEYILREIESGKSAEEIRDDEKFEDFSVSKIYKAFGIRIGADEEASCEEEN